MKNAICGWPNCKDSNHLLTNIPVMLVSNKGLKPIIVKGQQSVLPTPLCEYHHHLALAGLCVIVKDEKQKTIKMMTAQDKVTVVEGIIKALVMSGKLDIFKKVKTAEENLINEILGEEK